MEQFYALSMFLCNNVGFDNRRELARSRIVSGVCEGGCVCVFVGVSARANTCCICAGKAINHTIIITSRAY